MAERLQKIIARAGVASRRKAEELIRAGKVTVNGRKVTEPGVTAEPTDHIAVSGEIIKTKENFVYYALNKPRGVITTSSDEQNRKTVVDLVPKSPRVVACGRLDAATTGLVILTNDGDLCYKLTHPKFEHEKEYDVTVTINNGPPIEERLLSLETGIMLDDGATAPAKISQVKRHGMQLHFIISLHEGRNRQVRRMCAAVGFDVVALKRIRVAKLMLGDLPEGRWRTVTPGEIVGD